MSFNFEEYGWKTFAKPSDKFQYQCSQCGECCRHVEDSIMLESLDIFRIAKFLKVEISEVITEYAEMIHLTTNFPVFVLKTKAHMGACVFLRSGKCSIHAANPRACRTYPLGVCPDEDHPGEFQYFLVSQKSHHYTGKLWEAGEWMNDVFSPEDREFMLYDTPRTLLIGKALAKTPSEKRERLLRQLLYFKYVALDTEKPFMPQYKENMERLLFAFGEASI